MYTLLVTNTVALVMDDAELVAPSGCDSAWVAANKFHKINWNYKPYSKPSKIIKLLSLLGPISVF